MTEEDEYGWGEVSIMHDCLICYQEEYILSCPPLGCLV